MEKYKKVLGVDYGDARTGLAYSDDLWLTSIGFGTIKSKKVEYTAECIVSKAKEINAELIVIGKPINMDGSEGYKVDSVIELANIIKTMCDIPIDFIDERRSTIQAYSIFNTTGTYGKKRKENIDTLSAEIILQTYMDKTKNEILRSKENETK